MGHNDITMMGLSTEVQRTTYNYADTMPSNVEDNVAYMYMRSDQKAFEHKMTSVREGNFADMIKLAQTQQLLSVI